MNDFSQEDQLVYKLTRQQITNQYQAGISVVHGSSSFPCNTLELGGSLEAADLGGQRIRVSMGALEPLITISVSSPHNVEALLGQTMDAVAGQNPC